MVYCNLGNPEQENWLRLLSVCQRILDVLNPIQIVVSYVPMVEAFDLPTSSWLQLDELSHGVGQPI